MVHKALLGITWKPSVVSSYTVGHPGRVWALGTFAWGWEVREEGGIFESSASLDHMVGQFGDILKNVGAPGNELSSCLLSSKFSLGFLCFLFPEGKLKV